MQLDTCITMTTVAVGGGGAGVGGGDNRDGRCERCRTFNPRQIAVTVSAHYHHYNDQCDEHFATDVFVRASLILFLFGWYRYSVRYWCRGWVLPSAFHYIRALIKMFLSQSRSFWLCVVE